MNTERSNNKLDYGSHIFIPYVYNNIISQTYTNTSLVYTNLMITVIRMVVMKNWKSTDIPMSGKATYAKLQPLLQLPSFASPEATQLQLL